MTVSVRQVQYNASTGTTIGIGLPSGTQPGEVTVVQISADSGPNVSTPSGWTQLGGRAGGSSATLAVLVAQGPTPGGSSGATFTLSSSARWQVVVTTYAGSTGYSSSALTYGNGTNPIGVSLGSTGATNTLTALLGLSEIGPAGQGTHTSSGFTSLVDYSPQGSATLTSLVRSTPNSSNGAQGTVQITPNGTPTGGGLSSAIGLLLTPAAVAPNAPVLTAPAAGAYSDLASGGTFGWTFSPNPGPAQDSQASYAFRRRAGSGSSEWWTGSGWTATETFLTGSAQSLTFPSGKWASGTTYAWTVANRTAAGLTGPYAAEQQITANPTPVVSINSPVGTAASSRPTVSWSNSGAGSYTQTGYRLLIYPLAVTQQAGFSPTQSNGAVTDVTGSFGYLTSQGATSDLTTGSSYVAYVVGTFTGGQTATSSAAQFMVQSSDTPATPLLLSVTPSAASGRVQLVARALDNILSGNQASADGPDGLQLVALSNVTVGTSSGAGAYSGANVYTLTAATAGQDTLAFTTDGQPVAAGQQYSGVAFFKSAANSRNIQARIDWYTGSNTLISSTTGPFYVDSGTGYTGAFVTGVAPATAVAAKIIVRVVAQGSELHYVDALGVFPDPNGTLPGTPWTRGGLVGQVAGIVEASQDAGSTWRTVATWMPSSPQVADTVVDVVSPPGVSLLYRLRTSANGVSSLPSNTLPATFGDNSTWYLSDPTDGTSLQVPPTGNVKVNRAVNGASQRVLGRASDVVVTDSVSGQRVSMTYLVTALAAQRALDMLLQRQHSMWLRSSLLGSLLVRIVGDYDTEYESSGTCRVIYRGSLQATQVDS